MKDPDLWQRLKNGDKNALEKVYQANASLLLEYGKRFAVDEPFVEDCIQDLFVDLWKSRERLGPTDSIRRYLMASLRRRIIRQHERLRRFQAAAEIDFRAEWLADDPVSGEETDPEKSLQVKSALEKLSKRQQEAVYLKYYAGLDYDDICAVMDINYQSVRNLISNALKNLRHYLTLFLLLFSKFFLSN